MSTTALSGCFDDQTCPYGEVLVHDGRYGNDGVCVRRSYAGTPSGSSSTPAKDPPASSSPTTPSTPAPSTPGDGSGSAPGPGPSTAPVPATCGGVVVQGDTVRVVDKSEAGPSFGDGSPNLSDGSYTLVQATFFRTGSTASPVRSLVAALDIKGPTLTVNARDASVAGLPDESLKFLFAQPGVMTKTCESMHGSISAWFFPFVVGGATQPQITYDANSGFVRMVVSRADGATELVFAK